MTVAELINELEKYPSDYDVVCYVDSAGNYEEVNTVNADVPYFGERIVFIGQ